MERLRELRAAMIANDCLGFDDVHAAIHAVLSHPDFAERWECSPRLILAVAAHRNTKKENQNTLIHSSRVPTPTDP